MVVFRKIQQLTSNSADLIAELDDAGLLQEEIKTYKKLTKKYDKAADKLEDLNSSLSKSERKRERVTDSIQHIEKRMEKMREKAGPFARVKFSRIFFLSKKGREYRRLKRKLTREKSILKVLDHSIDLAEAEIKMSYKDVQDKEKRMNRMGKMLKKEWFKAEYEIKLIREYKNNKEELKEIYDEESIKLIKDSIIELQENGEIAGTLNAKDIFKRIQKDIKERNKLGNKNAEKISLIKKLGLEEKNEQLKEEKQVLAISQNQQSNEDVQEEKDKEDEKEQQEDEKEKDDEENENEKTENAKEKDEEENEFKKRLNMRRYTENGININYLEKAANSMNLTPDETLLLLGILRNREQRGDYSKDANVAKKEMGEYAVEIINKIKNGELDKEYLDSKNYYMDSGAKGFKDAYDSEKQVSDRTEGISEYIALGLARKYQVEEERESQASRFNPQRDNSRSGRTA